MVTLTRVALTTDSLKEQLREIGCRTTTESVRRAWYDGDYRIVYWEVEAYFPEADVTPEREQELLDVIDGTAWELEFRWDVNDEDEYRGVLFERHLRG